MNKFFPMAMMALSGTAAWAASAVVWSSTEKVTMEPAYSYEYDYGSTSTAIADTVGDVIEVTFEVYPETKKTSTGAGYGFGWEQVKNSKGKFVDSPISLASYKGMCLTYTADYPFRVDFKQDGIDDDNYYGMEMPASGAVKSSFIDFSLLKRGWKSDAVSWNAQKQLGVQFSYKNSHIKSGSDANDNTLSIYEITLGDGCPTFAPEVLVKPIDVTLNEGDTLEYPLSEIFADKDGGSKVTVKLSTDDVVLLNEGTSFDFEETLRFVAKANTNGAADVTFSAKDAEHAAVTYEFNIEVVDRENAPVAVDDTYETDEEKPLTVTATKSLLLNDYDADGDKFYAQLVDEPKHGELIFDQAGVFKYTPEKDFYGTETFTYVLVERPRASDETYEPKTSEPATVTIKVANEPDPAEVAVLNSTIYVGETEMVYGDTIVLEEDGFQEIEVCIPAENVEFSDPDALDLEGMNMTATVGKNIVTVEYLFLDEKHYIIIKPIEDANGVTKVNLVGFVDDDSVSVSFFVKVEPTPDNPKAMNDSCVVKQDGSLKVAASKGVLANDVNPDDPKSKLTAVLDEEPSHGKLDFKKDGSFTYTPKSGFYGEDSFEYHAVNEDGEKSESAVVTITVEQDMSPLVVVDAATLDTTLKEDFTKVLSYGQATVLSWFESQVGQTLKIEAESEDDKLKVSVTAAGSISVKSVPDSAGDAYFKVTATDEAGSTSLRIHVTLLPVNDKPVLLKVSDTVYVSDLEDWEIKVDLTKYILDIDGDTLEYTANIGTAASKRYSAEFEGDTMIVQAKKNVKFAKGDLIAFGVKAADATTYVTFNFYVVFGDESTSLPTVALAPKATWQNAIATDAGKVSLCDMQGRVMWSAKLPASEADVRAAAAQVQGRKILRVNKQTWTIK